MQKMRSVFAAVNNAVVDQLLFSLTTPTGHRYDYNMIGFNLPDDTSLTVYLEDEHVITYQRDGDESTDHWPLNWALTEGMEVKVYASNASGGVQDIGFTIGYDDVTEGV